MEDKLLEISSELSSTGIYSHFPNYVGLHTGILVENNQIAHEDVEFKDTPPHLESGHEKKL